MGLPEEGECRRPAFAKLVVAVIFVLGTVTPGAGKTPFYLCNLYLLVDSYVRLTFTQIDF